MTKDWLAWHEGYHLRGSPLQERLVAVQERLAALLEAPHPSSRALLSLCAGDGRDVIPVLEHLTPGRDCRATLVELSPVLAARAEQHASEAGVNVEVIVGDAGDPGVFRGALPVDVLLLCGIFGNVPDADVANTVAHLGGLVRSGGSVIWTRHRRPPDLTPAIRRWFLDAGFVEDASDSPGPDSWSVAVSTNVSAPVRDPGSRLFTFAP
jgi:SAM-dependent methyltransferase